MWLTHNIRIANEIEMYGSMTKTAIEDAKENNERYRAMIYKCGDYMKEKERAEIDPSVFVMKACLDILQGYNVAMYNMFAENVHAVQKIEGK